MAGRTTPHHAPSRPIQHWDFSRRCRARRGDGGSPGPATAFAAAHHQSTGPPEPGALERILARHGLSYDDNPSFDWLTPAGRGAAVGVAANERIVVGSWADALLCRALVSLERVVYVIDQSELASLRRTRNDRRSL